MSKFSDYSHQSFQPHSRGFSSGTLFVAPSPPGTISDHDDTNLRTASVFQSSRLFLKPQPPVQPRQESVHFNTPDPDISELSNHTDTASLSPSNSQSDSAIDFQSPINLLNVGTRSTRIYAGTQSDKARRLLASEASSSVYLISMHGAMHELLDITDQSQSPIQRRRDAAREVLLDDACLISSEDQTFAVLGHVRDSHQLSLVDLSEDNPHPYAIDLKRPWNQSKRGGVGSICAMEHPNSFATGGYDRVVHLWRLDSNHTSALAQPLAINHTNVVQSLLPICDTSHKLISAGADCKVNVYDLSSERVVNSFKTSNQISHLHRTHSPICTLLEVLNLDSQFELRDHRIVPERPVLRFGYPTNQARGRYMKGASLPLNSLFTCGDRYGRVRFWDLRKPEKVASEILCFAEPQKVVQVLFHQSRLLVCSENGEIVCIEYSLS